MRTEIRVRPAEEADIPAVAALEAETFALGASEAVLRRMLAGGAVLLTAREGGELLGYGYFTSVLDEGSVGNIAVRPAYRRRGVGRALTEAMAAAARERGLAFLTLEVRESNLAARRLYERCGFRTEGVRKNYYEKPTENALIMTLRFSEEGTIC
ncbi:MAG: ribosomal protein S18-alanine N-acetyltransferase [Oscillospiraceae bacterium]|nr:ribosomal protein S18-alanine N-acetyltransferase [Oscillospiraceae bacterium]